MVLGVALAAAGCREDVFGGVQVIRVTTLQEVSLHGLRCLPLASEEGSGGAIPVPTSASGRPDFWFEEDTSEDGVTVTFGSGPTTLESKLYRNMFFETGKLDRFIVTSAQGDRYVVSVWGSNECSSCPPDSKTSGTAEDGPCGATEALELVAGASDE